MECVLATQELLESIFSFGDDSSNYRCARVRKTWKIPALKYLWRDISGLKNLFCLLAPLETDSVHNSTKTYSFGRDITLNDWKRFDKYAHFVKFLKVTRENISPLYHVVARTRPRLILLPNLLEMNIHCDSFSVSYSTLFLHAGLSRVIISGASNESEINRLFKYVEERSPGIKHFRLQKLCARAEAPALINFAPLFRYFTSLIHVTLPAYTLTSSVLSSLCMLPKLESITTFYYTPSGNVYATGNRGDVLNFNPFLLGGSFPSLKQLHIAAKLKDLTRFFSLPFAPKKIMSLRVELMVPWSRDDIQEFLECLSRTCGMLEELEFVINFSDTSFFLPTSGFDVVTLETLRPVCSMEKLREFTIEYPRPLVLTDDDVEELVHNWPNLEALRLNPEPLRYGKPMLTLRVLDTIARHCPKLKELHLYLNGTTVKMLESPCSKFTNLGCLIFGASSIEDPEEVAVYLSEICPESCKISSVRSWFDRLNLAIDPGYLTMKITSAKAWVSVSSLVGPMIRITERERARMRGQERRSLY